MKNVKILRKKANGFNGLSVKFAASDSGCFCDFDACHSKCGCGIGRDHIHMAWRNAGSIDGAAQAVPQE